jgi:predicted Zn-dependent protease
MGALRLLPLFVISLSMLTGCSTRKTSDRYREGDNRGQNSELTVEQEKQLTKEALVEMKKDFPPVKNQELQNYIERLGQKIVRANNLHNHPYTYSFTCVDSPQVNAFALPAGSVFITTPIIAMADSEAEIAGVLGHEIGHVVARHTAERMYVAKQEQKKTILFGGVGAALGGAAGYFLGKKLCQEGDTACQAKITLYGAGGGAVAGIMVQKYGFMKNSQEDELESDRVGFRYAVNTNYDKNNVGDFYQKLFTLEQQSKKNQNGLMSSLSDAMSSHPPSKDRIRQAEEMKELIKVNGKTTTTSEFFRMKKLAQELVSQHQKK